MGGNSSKNSLEIIIRPNFQQKCSVIFFNGKNTVTVTRKLVLLQEENTSMLQSTSISGVYLT